MIFFFFSSRRRHTRLTCDWSSDVCSSDLADRGTFIHSHVERANYDYTVSPTMLLHLGAGYQQNNFFDDAPILNFDAASTLGLKGATVKRNVPVFTGFCPP